MEISMEVVSSRVLGSDDRISRLPDPVICHILSFLKTKLAVATSVLSKRWKFGWTGVTSLNFVEDSDDERFEHMGDSNDEWLGHVEDSDEKGIRHMEDSDVEGSENVEDSDVERSENVEDSDVEGSENTEDSDVEGFEDMDYSDDEEENSSGKMNFVQFVNKVLLEHNVNNLEMFRLMGGEGCKREPVYFNMWINYAIVRNVKSLTLSVDSVKINLPSALFTCASLASLTLFGKFKLELPPAVCLPKLESLGIYDLCCETDECVSKLISGCPILHSLTIFRSPEVKVLGFSFSSPSLKLLKILPNLDAHNPDGDLRIDAPNLERLVLMDRVSCQVSTSRLSSAESFDIWFWLIIDANTAESEMVVKLAEDIDSVIFLNLEQRIMKEFSYATIPLSMAFYSLMKLHLSCECCHWNSLRVLLSRLVKLEVLIISRKRCCEMTHEVFRKDPVEVPACLSYTLAQISIAPFGCHEDEMEMIRYILKFGAVLELIDLQSLPYGVDRKFEMLQTISMFPRLSSVCSINFT